MIGFIKQTWVLLVLIAVAHIANLDPQAQLTLLVIYLAIKVDLFKKPQKTLDK